MIQLLRRLQQTEYLSYIFISHDLNVVKALCHKVMVLRHAKLWNISRLSCCLMLQN